MTMKKAAAKVSVTVRPTMPGNLITDEDRPLALDQFPGNFIPRNGEVEMNALGLSGIASLGWTILARLRDAKEEDDQQEFDALSRDAKKVLKWLHKHDILDRQSTAAVDRAVEASRPSTNPYMPAALDINRDRSLSSARTTVEPKFFTASKNTHDKGWGARGAHDDDHLGLAWGRANLTAPAWNSDMGNPNHASPIGAENDSGGNNTWPAHLNYGYGGNEQKWKRVEPWSTNMTGAKSPHNVMGEDNASSWTFSALDTSIKAWQKDKLRIGPRGGWDKKAKTNTNLTSRCVPGGHVKAKAECWGDGNPDDAEDPTRDSWDHGWREGPKIGPPSSNDDSGWKVHEDCDHRVPGAWNSLEDFNPGGGFWPDNGDAGAHHGRGETDIKATDPWGMPGASRGMPGGLWGVPGDSWGSPNSQKSGPRCDDSWPDNGNAGARRGRGKARIKATDAWGMPISRGSGACSNDDYNIPGW